MQLANQEAQRFNHEYIGTEHILLGLVKEDSGIPVKLLKGADIDPREVRLEIERIVKAGPNKVTMGKLPQTARARHVIEYAIQEARELKNNCVGQEHLFLGLLKEREGVAAQVLQHLGMTWERARAMLVEMQAKAPTATEAEKVSPPGSFVWTHVSRQKSLCPSAKALLYDGAKENPQWPDLAVMGESILLAIAQERGLDLSKINVQMALVEAFLAGVGLNFKEWKLSYEQSSAAAEEPKPKDLPEPGIILPDKGEAGSSPTQH
jgi:ATP-dependent Clp protease ATP-binding subunit ClpA